MGFGLTSAMVSEFASKPFVRAALASPFKPSSVLSFHCGIDMKDPKSKDDLREGSFFERMHPFWYSGNPDFDALCRPFSEVVRAAGRGELAGDAEDWDSVDGRVSRIVLCDQVSRNCFRGTNEAFLYDETATALARGIASEVLSSTESARDASGARGGEIYGCYAYFCALSFMHSEELSDHDNCVKIIEWGRSVSPKIGWDGTLDFELEHKAVIERFGRYPHRNAKKGRESTEEEERWLADTENLPGWAKSQG